MKNATYISALALTAALSVPTAHAAEYNSDTQKLKQAGRATTGALIGAAAGGPIGMIVGLIAGAKMGDYVEKNNEIEQELSMAKEDINQLEIALIEQTSEVAQLEEGLAKKLEFQVLFNTESDQLNGQDLDRIDSLANYMNNNPQLNVRLDAHTDARGAQKYNQVLSEKRAEAVSQALQARGITKQRIQSYAHGASFASDIDAGHEQFALERRVSIELFQDDASEVAAK